MPGASHEGLVEVFRREPEVVVELLRALQIEVPGYEATCTDSANFSELQPPEYRSDLVVLLKDGERSTLVAVVEVQLERDERKRYSWPAYLAVARARHKCEAVVLVFSPVGSVAGWASQPVRLGPGNTFQAVVVGPKGIPLVAAPEGAGQNVELAVLSAVAHGQPQDEAEVEGAVQVAAATLEACRALPDERAVLYSDLVLASLSQAVLEAVMSIPAGYEFQSEFARKHQQVGRVEGQRLTLLKQLRLRFHELPADALARIQAADSDQLDLWAERVLSAETLEEVLAD